MNEKIAKEAAAFYLVGKGLFKKVLKNPKKHGVATAEDMLAFPMIVNLAFACELFFKSMLPEEELGRSSGHKLRDLYDKQNEDVKHEMCSSIMEKHSVTEQWINNELDKSSNAFYEWRYFYEGERALTASISILLYTGEYFYKLYTEQYEQ